MSEFVLCRCSDWIFSCCDCCLRDSDLSVCLTQPFLRASKNMLTLHRTVLMIFHHETFYSVLLHVFQMCSQQSLFIIGDVKALNKLARQVKSAHSQDR